MKLRTRKPSGPSTRCLIFYQKEGSTMKAVCTVCGKWFVVAKWCEDEVKVNRLSNKPVICTARCLVDFTHKNPRVKLDDAWIVHGNVPDAAPPRKKLPRKRTPRR